MTIFGTKAETLERLRPKLSSAVILEQFTFTVQDWANDSARVLGAIERRRWSSGPVIVRSSATFEDSTSGSQAGRFTSIINVTGKGPLVSAIEEVIGSYAGDDNDQQSHDDQVLVQPMLQQVVTSGVALTRDQTTGAPYITVNFDDSSHRTDTVTSGAGISLGTRVIMRSAAGSHQGRWRGLLQTLAELESLCASDAIDVEFAVTDADRLVILQVRPLVLSAASPAETDDLVEEAVTQIRRRFEQLNRPHPYAFGGETLFGIMPDWNPAEIIGTKPRQLSLSLYKELVTDNIWAYQRDNYGYKNLRSCPLLISFAGLPYIDVRVSFSSFIPADIEDPLAHRLVDYYLEALKRDPSNHDKIEFEVVHSCYAFDLPSRLAVLKDHGFQPAELHKLAASLRSLTNRIIAPESGLLASDKAKVERLKARRELVLNGDLTAPDKIYWLLEDCKRYGTLPFAGLARAGFVAVQMLRSLIGLGVLTQQDYEQFLASLKTVSGELESDFHRLPRDEFLAIYGHLRPGTYDIISPRYDEAPDVYFDRTSTKEPKPKVSNFGLALDQMNRINILLQEHGIETDVVGFCNFVQQAIEAREYGKFVFTRSVSDVLGLIGELGSDFGFSVEDLSFIDIGVFKELYSGAASPRETLEQSIRRGRQAYSISQKLRLPPLLAEDRDIVDFDIPAATPNFVTTKRIRAATSMVDAAADLSGRIVCTPSADPGYDWIFARNIAGLITMYGGANSHMAIRAAELEIPAVIGCGQAFYQEWSAAELLEVDCASKQVRVLR